MAGAVGCRGHELHVPSSWFALQSWKTVLLHLIQLSVVKILLTDKWHEGIRECCCYSGFDIQNCQKVFPRPSIGNQRQQIDSSSCVLISRHSSTNIAKKLIFFISSRLSCVAKSQWLVSISRNFLIGVTVWLRLTTYFTGGPLTWKKSLISISVAITCLVAISLHIATLLPTF